MYKLHLQSISWECVPSRFRSSSGVFLELRVSLWWREQSICQRPFLLFVDSLTRWIPWVNPQSRIRIYAVSGSVNSSFFFRRTQWLSGMAAIAVSIRLRSSGVWVLKWGYTGFSSFDIVIVIAIVMVMAMDLWFIEVCVRLYVTTSVLSSLLKLRVVKKSVKRALNL